MVVRRKPDRFTAKSGGEPQRTWKILVSDLLHEMVRWMGLYELPTYEALVDQ